MKLLSDLQRRAKQWNEFVQLIGVVVGVIGLIVAIFVGFLAYQQLSIANNQLRSSTPLKTVFSETWEGGHTLVSWGYEMIPYRTATIYVSGVGNNCSSTLQNHPQIQVETNNLTIISTEHEVFKYCDFVYQSGRMVFLPISVTQPALNVNIDVVCDYVNATTDCGRPTFTGEVVFYP